jgi:DNA repair protein RadC
MGHTGIVYTGQPTFSLIRAAGNCRQAATPYASLIGCATITAWVGTKRQIRINMPLTSAKNRSTLPVSSMKAAQHLLTHIFTPFAAFEQEELWTLLLNTKHRITHEAMIYRGSLNQVTVRLADVFKPAIRYNAACLILAHNHPSSGDPSPSPEDVFLTEQAFTIGQTLELAVLDHLVIGQDTWISLKEQGLGFPP